MAVNIFPAPSTGERLFSFSFNTPYAGSLTGLPAGSYQVQSSNNFDIVDANGRDVLTNGLFVANSNPQITVRGRSLSITQRTREGVPSAIGNSNTTGLYVVGNELIQAGTRGLLAVSSDAQSWDLRRPLPNADYQVTFAFAGGTYLVGSHPLGGATRQVATSTNGITWTQRNTPMVENSGIFGFDTPSGPIFIAIGTWGGNAQVHTSTNGITWTYRAAFDNRTLRGVAFGVTSNGPLFVLTGDGSFLRTSTDAITWTARTGGASTTWGPVVFGSSGFVVGGAFDSWITRSSDGITWTATNVTADSSSFQGIFVNGQYIFVRNSTVAISTDAVTWTHSATGLAPGRGVAMFRNELYAIASHGGTTKSSNLFAPIVPINNMNTFSRGNGLILAAGSGGQVVTSTNGVTWGTPTNWGSGLDIFGSAFGIGTFVLVGINGWCRTTTDGVTFTGRTLWSGSTVANSVTWGGGWFFAGAQANSWISYSTDSVTWTSRVVGNAGNWYVTAYGEGQHFIASGTQIQRTHNPADNWFGVGFPSGIGNINAMTFANGMFVITTDTGNVCTMQGLVVTHRGAVAPVSLGRVVFFDGIWVASGTANTYVTSTNGITWTSVTSVPFTAGNMLPNGNTLLLTANSADGVAVQRSIAGTGLLVLKEIASPTALS